MIQLAIDNKTLQPMVNQAYRDNSRELLNSKGFATNIIKQMIEMLPTTYFIVDGLDEIVEVERTLLLETMLKLHEKHGNLKLLISSRPERDTVMTLTPKVEPIRVEDRNGQDIQAYVKKRADSWLSRLTLEPRDRADIERQMASIEKFAKGKFSIVQFHFIETKRC